MSLLRSVTSHICQVAAVMVASAALSFAQQPQDFYVSPTVLPQGECYDAWVTPFSPWMHLDIQYTFNGGPLQTVYDWPVMDETGVARSICTNGATAPGDYTFVNIRNSLEPTWLYVGRTVTVLPPVQQPQGFSVSPAVLVQGECYDAWVTPLSPGMYLDFQYTLNGGPLQTVYGWPMMDETGVARNICTDFGTVPGTYVFVNIKNSQASNWVNVNTPVTVLPQPVALRYDPPVAYAGADFYSGIVTNGESMAVRIRFNWNGYQDLLGILETDAAGRFVYGPLDHYSWTGLLLVTGIQNSAAQPANWVNVNIPYYILGPQPTAFHLDKSSIRDDATNGDQTYRMYAANGADMLIDFRYAIDNGPVQEVYGWPSLYADFPGSWNGHSGDISASACTIPGLYRFLAVRNSNNSAWAPVSPPAELTVIGPGAPEISMVSRASGRPGEHITATISGQKFCGVALTTDYPGLSVSLGVPTETQITAVFNIASTASAGTANVTLHTYSGSATFQFVVNPAPVPPPLRREYIYLGDRALAVESP
jgi:hypothetical protein